MTCYVVDSDKYIIVVNTNGCASVNEAIHNYLKNAADKFINPKILTHHLIFIRFIEGQSPEYKILPKHGTEHDQYLRDGWYLYQGLKKTMIYPLLISFSPESRSRSRSIEWSDNSLKNSLDAPLDDFANFVFQCIKVNVNEKIDKIVLFNRYVLWCSTNRVMPESHQSLDIYLHRNGYMSNDDDWLGLSFN